MLDVHVPLEIVRHILTHMPIEPLLRFRCVCKEWKNMIDDPDFTKLQADHHKARGSDMLVIMDNDGELYSVPLCLVNRSKTQLVEATDMKRRILPQEVKTVTSLAASCHDLILICPDKVWELWNLFTGECLKLPRFDSIADNWEYFVYAGLGYDAANDDYKVVRIAHVPRRLPLVTLIYSLKSGTWRKIKNSSLPCGILHTLPGVFVNGRLYWVADDGLLALNLITEAYCNLQLPFHSTNYSSCNYLGNLGERLCFSCTRFLDGPDTFSVWILQDCRGEAGWANFFTLINIGHDFMLRDLRPVAYMESKKQIVLTFENMLVLYNVEKMESVKVVAVYIDKKELEFCKAFPARLDWLNGSCFGEDGSVAPEGTLGCRKRKRTHG